MEKNGGALPLHLLIKYVLWDHMLANIIYEEYVSYLFILLLHTATLTLTLTLKICLI